ncbi:MAG: hypothetical protein ABSC36_05705, partial [Gaiellaceae bacterium]
WVHTCALLSDGTIRCWGRNGGGQLGDGKTNHGHADAYRVDYSPIPVEVSGITSATELSAGGAHTCALFSRGTIECWGNDGWGQLGDGARTNSSTPVEVIGITNAIQVSEGGYYTCSLLSGGTVKCWGAGPLGSGTTDKSSTPVTVEGSLRRRPGETGYRLLRSSLPRHGRVLGND